jgi:mRNA interferase MazF
MHNHLRTVIAAPLTSKSRPAGFRVPVHFNGQDGLILLDQIRTLDKQRLIKRMGSVSAQVLGRTLETLGEVFQP